MESVFAQTFPSWRLIISENGPGSEKLKLALESFLNDPRVSHIVTGDRVSLAHNWTNAVRNTAAPYIAMLNDDDRWQPEFLQRRVELLEKHSQCAFAFAGYTMIDEQSRETGDVTFSFSEGPHRVSEMLPVFYQYNIVAPSAGVIRQSAFEAIGAAYRDIFLTDHDMYLRLAAKFDVGFLEGVDSECRIYDTQNSATRRLELGRGHLEVLESAGDVPVGNAVRRRAHAKAHVACALDNAELGRRRAALSHVGKAVRAEPLSLLRPEIGGRIALVLATLAAGRAGLRLFTRLRLGRFEARTTGIRRAQRRF